MFDLGRVDISTVASTALAACGPDLVELLRRHRRGDWGDASERQQRHNDWALQHGDIIRSTYRLAEASHRDYPESEWSVGYGGMPGDPWTRVWEEAERRGLIRHGSIGQAACTLFKAREMVTIYERQRRTDPFGLFGLEEQTDLP